MADTVTTVLVSVLTSGVVTLGLEWLVKPRLEARKSVFIDTYRKRDMFRRHMMTILLEISKWSNYEEPKGMAEPFRQRVNEDRRRAIQRIDDAIRAMNDDINDLAFSHAGHRIPKLISRYIFAVYVVQLSSRSRADKWKVIKELTELAYNWLFIRSWRVRTRIKAMFGLTAALEKYAPEEG
jgi:hypothetical protein